MKVKVIQIKVTELTRLGHLPFVGKATEIAQNFEDNATELPAPPVSVPILKTAVEDLAGKTILAQSDAGSTNDRNARDTQAAVVLGMLLQNAGYVLALANAKQTLEEKIELVELAGYTVANETHNPIDAVPVTGLKVKVPVVPGERTISARWVRGNCHSFIVMGTQGNPSSPDAEWKQLLISSKARCVLTLEPGVWAIRVIGVYPAGQAAPSDDVSFVLS